MRTFPDANRLRHSTALAPISAVLLALGLSGCLGGEGSPAGNPEGGAGEGTATLTQNASTPATPSTGATVSGVPMAGGSLATRTDSGTPYARVPVIASCDAGTLTGEEKAAVLAAFNEIRALHRLSPVVYDNTSDGLVQKSALLGVANGRISHSPATNWFCYSPEGAQGSAQSNLYYAAGFTPASTSVIAEFLIDDGVSGLGHRRWLLHPFLAQTAFGRVDGIPFSGGTTRYAAMSLRVLGYPDSPPVVPAPEYVAYPEGRYPSRYFRHGWFMSFSVLADPGRTFGNGSDTVDMGAATVQVSDRVGTVLAVSERSHNYQGFGIPNVLQWKAAGTRNGVDYVVRISGVRVKGTARDFEYGFRIE